VWTITVAEMSTVPSARLCTMGNDGHTGGPVALIHLKNENACGPHQGLSTT